MEAEEAAEAEAEEEEAAAGGGGGGGGGGGRCGATKGRLGLQSFRGAIACRVERVDCEAVRRRARKSGKGVSGRGRVRDERSIKVDAVAHDLTVVGRRLPGEGELRVRPMPGRELGWDARRPGVLPCRREQRGERLHSPRLGAGRCNSEVERRTLCSGGDGVLPELRIKARRPLERCEGEDSSAARPHERAHRAGAGNPKDNQILTVLAGESKCRLSRGRFDRAGLLARACADRSEAPAARHERPGRAALPRDEGSVP